MSDLPEKDWKLLRRLQPVLLDRFCEKVLREAVEIARSPDGTNHERYLKLYRFIREQDRDMATAFDDYRRSTARVKINNLYALGLMTEAELAGFSDEIRAMVLLLNSSI